MRKIFNLFKKKSECFSDIKDRLNISWNNRKYLIVACVFLTTILIVSITLSHRNKTDNDVIISQNKRSEKILRELNDINLILNDFKNNTFNANQKISLQALEKDINSIQKSITDIAKNSDIEKISNQISSVKDDVDSKMSDIKKSISVSLNNKEYVDASALPFHVQSIDVIAGQSYVSIDYDNHIFPLAIGDTLANWQVNNADYDSSSAEFINDKNQFVRINLKGN